VSLQGQSRPRRPRSLQVAASELRGCAGYQGHGHPHCLFCGDHVSNFRSIYFPVVPSGLVLLAAVLSSSAIFPCLPLFVGLEVRRSCRSSWRITHRGAYCISDSTDSIGTVILCYIRANGENFGYPKIWKTTGSRQFQAERVTGNGHRPANRKTLCPVSLCSPDRASVDNLSATLDHH
jgi:hypothetical protein